MPQQVRDLVLSLQWLGLLLWAGLDPWPKNFYKLWVWPKKKNCFLSSRFTGLGIREKI